MYVCMYVYMYVFSTLLHIPPLHIEAQAEDSVDCVVVVYTHTRTLIHIHTNIYTTYTHKHTSIARLDLG
jgi:hypothetical protein